MAGKEWEGQEVVLSPPKEPSGNGKWLSVDGEDFEVLPMEIKLRPRYLTFYTHEPI